MGKLLLPFGLLNNGVEVVEPLSGVEDFWIVSEHIPFLIHEAGCVELAAYVHAYHQGMIPIICRFSICLVYCVLCMAVIPPVKVFLLPT
jgi:hypothetical protein